MDMVCNQPSKSSNAEPPCFCCWGCEGAGEAVLEAGAPQIPALAFSLAILARLGPLLAPALALAIPALALAEDQRDPKASPEGLEALLAAGLLPVAEGVTPEEAEEGLACEANGCGEPVETEVK